MYQRIQLDRFLNELVEAFDSHLKVQRVEAEVDIDRPVSIFAEESSLRRACCELLLQAVEMMPQGGELLITVVEATHAVEIEFADSGPGLPDSVKTGADYLAQRGLRIVQDFIAKHDAGLVAANCPEGGAALTLRFPYRTLKAAA